MPEGMDQTIYSRDSGDGNNNWPVPLAGTPAQRYSPNSSANAALEGFTLVDDAGIAIAGDRVAGGAGEPGTGVVPALGDRGGAVAAAVGDDGGGDTVLIAGDGPVQPSTQAATDQVHMSIVHLGNVFGDTINRSNTVGHVPRLLAESTLRTLTAFQWGGTGITQHGQWQTSVPARRAVISPAQDRDGVIQLGPTEWAACHADVMSRTDQLNRRWANCSEQAASFAHIIHQQILTNPAMAGLQVCQAYGNGHSWVEVRYPNGGHVIYDTWGGRAQNWNEAPASYRAAGIRYTPWVGRSS